MFNDFFKLTGIRKKLFVYYFIVVLTMGLTSFYSYFNAKSGLEKTNSIFMDYIDLNEVYVNVNSLETELERYLTTQSSEALLNYYNYNNKLLEQLEEKPALSYDANGLMLKDIYYMTEELIEEGDAAVYAKRGRNTAEYLAHFENSKKTSSYIKMYINDLLYNKLNEGSAEYNENSARVNYLLFMNIFIILITSAFSMFLALLITYRITKPIINLAHAAERIAEEDFNIEPLHTDSKDEISILSKAFNQMVVSIRNYIANMIQQKEIEGRLREQELQNLKMKSVLKDAELKALQSQINPHFLFNTLNYATQLAMIEGADQSSEFIHKAADLFRYSLKGLDSPVTLREEVANIESYIFVLKARFKDRVDFALDIDQAVLEAAVPGIILQPIVENAFIHGLENVAKGGLISLKTYALGEMIGIEISDNGKGMTEEKIRQILQEVPDNAHHEYHLTGLGLRNVVERLKLFYSIEDSGDVIEIYSQTGAGTRIVLKIPKKGSNVDVQVTCSR